MNVKVLSFSCLSLCLALIVPSGMAQSDPLSGTWTGDWGFPNHRNPVTVELRWDGSALTGTVNPGPNALELSTASFNPETGEVVLEADAPFHGAVAHYIFAGKVEGNTMMGSWKHDNVEGDFKVTKQ